MTIPIERSGSNLARQYGAFLDAAPDAMIIADRNGNILLANQHAERLFGYGRDELVGRPI